jgi:anti-sigma factor RsiW
MTNKDAIFLLGAFRPNGADANDPEFAEALARAGSDAELKAWFDDQRGFDSAIAARLQSIPAPAELRSRILTGGRVSRPAPWFNPRWLWAIAAMVMVLAVLTVGYEKGYRENSRGWQDQALASLTELVSGEANFDAKSPNVADLQQWLRANGSPTVGALPASLRRLASLGCKTVAWHGRPISIICFHGPGGEMVHLAMTERAGLENPPPDGHPVFGTKDGWQMACWSQGEMAMMLITRAPADQLRALLAVAVAPNF